VSTASSYWYKQFYFAWQAFPYHWLIEPEEKELRQFLLKVRGAGLRYSAPLSSTCGKLSYHAAFDGMNYDLDILSKNARHNVRRGLHRCEVRPITFQKLAHEGWALQTKTLKRQNRKIIISEKEWINLCLTAGELPGFEAWGALVKGRLAASIITFQMDDCCYMLYQQCDEDYLRLYTNNALSFVVTKEMISRPQIKSILYGLHSIDASADVDEFKFRMGYRPKPVKQRVVFHPLLKSVFRPITHRLLEGLSHSCVGRPFFSKAAGFVRFGLDSRLESCNQEQPAAFSRHPRNTQI